MTYIDKHYNTAFYNFQHFPQNIYYKIVIFWFFTQYLVVGLFSKITKNRPFRTDFISVNSLNLTIIFCCKLRLNRYEAAKLMRELWGR